MGLQYGVAYNESGAAVSAMGADAKDYDNDGVVDIFYNDSDGADLGAVSQSARKILSLRLDRRQNCRS